MEKKSPKRLPCRLAPQDGGRIRWCLGEEKRWQGILKKLVFVPLILLPLIAIIIFLLRNNEMQRNDQDTGVSSLKYNSTNKSMETLFAVKSEKSNSGVLNRRKRFASRHQRLSSLFKYCYKLYRLLYYSPETSDKVSDDKHNRKLKYDYTNEYPGYFDKDTRFFISDNPEKHEFWERIIKFWNTKCVEMGHHYSEIAKLWPDQRSGERATYKYDKLDVLRHTNFTKILERKRRNLGNDGDLKNVKENDERGAKYEKHGVRHTNFTRIMTRKRKNVENDNVKSFEQSDEDESENKHIKDEHIQKDLHHFWIDSRNATEIRQLQAKIMKKYMNLEVDPCDNFYEFACGNWKKYYEVPPDKAVYDTFEMVRENLDHVLRKLLEGSNDKDVQYSNEGGTNHTAKDFVGESFVSIDNSDATTKVRNFYKSCIQEDLINKRGDKPLKKLLYELGGWPVITPGWKKSEFDLTWTMSRLRLLNNDVLISQWIGPDVKNSGRYIIHIDQTSLGLPTRDYYLDQSNFWFLKSYKSFILSVVNILGAEEEVALRDVDELIKFEIKLAEILASAEERRNISEIYLKTNIGALTKHFPKFPWVQYFRVVLGKDIDLNTPVACYCARYLHQLLNLLSKTNPRVLQNYLLWRFVRHRTANMDKRFMESKQKFYFSLFGREKQPPRWQFCIAQTNSNMGMALGALFVKYFFDKNSKSDTTQITEKMIEAFKHMVFKNTWLDHHTKVYARQKINNMDLKIGFPDYILDESELTKKFSDVEIHPNYFFENVLSILRHASKEEHKKVDLIVDKEIWNTPPAVVNAYYSRTKNQIMFPAGILQPPFYHKFFPKALNFGGIGVVIGHEITHGFDDKGRLFDQFGNLHLWWKKQSIDMFNQKAQCIIDQYSEYTLPDLKISVDGITTQGENIADNGGLRQAFRAYEAWLDKNPHEEETLPSISLNEKQLFFLNFAQVWCGTSTNEVAKSRIKTSVHSPGLFRVIGAVSNSQEFSRVYNCPKNSPMNPENKCIIW